MALVRIQRLSPNHSGPRSKNQLVVVHTSEGAQTESSLSGFLAQESARVSYQVCFDNNGDPNVITECVAPNLKAWAAMNANDWGCHGCLCTPSGASQGWTAADWLARPTLLDKCSRWIAEECRRYGIPIQKVNADDIRAGRRGVCGHGDCSAAGAGGSHSDPGPRFVWREVLAMASGGAPGPAPGPPVDPYIFQLTRKPPPMEVIHAR